MRKRNIIFLLIGAISLFMSGNATVFALPSFEAADTSYVQLLAKDDNPDEYKDTHFVGEFEIGYCGGAYGNQKMYYSLDGGDAIEYEEGGGCSLVDGKVNKQKIQVSTSLLTNKPEHTIKAWLVEGSNKSEELTQEFVVLDTRKTYSESTLGLFTIFGSRFPIQTTIKAEKVTDQTIINKVGTSYVYKLDTMAGGKDYTYYKAKYGIESDALPGTNALLPEGLSKSPDMKLYKYTSNFTKVESTSDCSDIHPEQCDGKYESFLGVVPFETSYIAYKYGSTVYNRGDAPEVVNVPDTGYGSGISYVIFGVLFSLVGFGAISMIAFKKNSSKDY